MAQYSNGYVVGFATVVCAVCSIFVSSAAVSLKETQEKNAKLDLQKNVVLVSGLIAPGVKASEDDVTTFFDPKSNDRIELGYVDLKAGITVESKMAEDYILANKDACEELSDKANIGKIRCLKKYKKVYSIYKEGKMNRLIINVEGKGLWSTLYGFLALGTDGKEIQGITFYKHGETPGLGGEVDNPNWKKEWEKKQAFDASGNVPSHFIKKGSYDPKTEVSSLSGATLTANGVDNLVKFWLGDLGYGPYLKNVQKGGDNVQR
jgi:Na+-transporting NADH:ubiquinone oxidoreductase subunit C